ncbi:unnamed protein product [Cuscuta campestris]|uniref:PHD-type domain-containing protein n=1 Tax=Cuscuta campestris TaxID=132261 RepID=A0A484L3V4_9ASTE|nr:unnamed protein product [Cuscuta campestris]
MAADSQQPTITKVKMKLADSNSRKLLQGEKVEVRNTEDGFLGSWHTGTVLKRGRLMCHVKYDHLLCENGSTNLVELVKVSSMIDEVVPAEWDPDNYRGVIRPSPPTLDIVDRTLHYGECVDLFYQDAWWEGVIFDRDDDLENRRVFFPDMGDEMTVCVKNLRITQDWNEVTEEWKPRGNWIFLEIVDEMGKKLPLLVSVKQIWYEVREKNRFKDWTISVRDFWRGSISVVLFDNLKLTITQFLSLLNSAQGFLQDGQSLEFSQLPLNDILESVEFIDNLLALDRTEVLPNSFNLSRIQKTLDEEIVPMDIAPTIDVVSTSDKNLEFLVTQSIDEMLLDGHEELHCRSSKLSIEDIKCSQNKTRLKWSAIELEAQSFPEALEESVRAGYRAPHDMVVKLRKHLLHLGWKIEYAIDYQRNRSMTRFRYFPPSGPVFMSLVKIREYLHTQSVHNQRTKREWSPIPLEPKLFPKAVEEYKRLIQLNIRPHKGLHAQVRRHLLCMGWKVEYAVDTHRVRYVSPCGTLVQSLVQILKGLDTLSVVPLHHQTSGDDSQTSMDENIVSEYNPQAVIDYVSNWSVDTQPKSKQKNVAKIANEAKQHLSYSGWKMSYEWKGDKKKVQYMSPYGKICYSLVTACKRYLVENAWSNSDASYLTGKSEFAHDDMEHVQPGHSAASKKRKFMALNRAGDAVASSQTSTRVLRSYKRARQVGPTSHQTPRSVLSWLIDNNVVLPRTKVHYRERDDSHPKRVGRISCYGIKCNCCQEIYGLSNFGAHAGSTDHSPSKNIFLEDGRSILECQLEMKRKIYAKKKEPRLKKVSHNIRTNDYICSICHDGGELILCDMCPSSFHPGCLGMMELPDGDWFCPFCCCGICGHSNDLFAANNAVNCSQCENQYHVGCIISNGLPKPGSYPEGYWFCNKKCEQIFFGLHKLLGKPICLGTDKLSWTLLKYPKPGNFSHNVPDDELAIESYSKLSVALGVMHECFEPIKESRTGRDLMEDIVFNRWSELGRLNFRGFYTVLLERNDELITVATVRVHGEKVAEVPFVATRFQYRRLGMCRILMNVLEKKLTELGVERLVLPAATSVLDTWTSSFGFSVINDSDRSNFSNFNIVNFYGTVMCQKLLTRTSMELIVFTESTQHIFGKADKEYSELDGTSAVSEVVQAEQNDRSGIIDQGPVDTPGGTTTSSNNPAPLLVLKQTSAPEFPAQMTLTDVSGRKEVGNDAGVGFLKCYKRRRKLLAGEAELFMKEVTP